MSRKILIIDGNSILNRAFFGVRPLTTSKGLFTHAVYGFVNILSGQLEALKPDYAVCAFDVHEPTFRHKKYDGYKANRHGMPDELKVQLPYAKVCAEALGFYVATLPGYEADDIIGTVGAFADKEADLHSYILTGDRDSLQLITENVSVILATNKENVLFDEAKFFEEYGVRPAQFADVKALMGDSSDNIPGVAGIGEKTALKLIAEYGTLDGVYDDIENKKLSATTLSKLQNDKDKAYLSQFLAKIDIEAPVGFTLSDIENKGYNKDKLLSLFTELEFSAFIKRFDLNEVQAKEECLSCEYIPLSDSAMSALNNDVPVAVTLDGDMVRIKTPNDAFEVNIFCPLAKEILENEERKLCTLDVKGLYKALKIRGIELSKNCFDISLAAYVLNPGESSYGLERLCPAYIARGFLSGSDECSAVLLLHEALTEKLKADGTYDYYIKAELPLARVLGEMELVGFKVDINGLSHFGELLQQRENDLTEAIYECAGEKFNLNSPKQLGEILFEKLKLPVAKKNKTGYSTSAEILEKLIPYHAIVPLILEYRTVNKLRSTYADGLRNVADENGIIHTTFNQTVTATGRLSSTEPNLQNIPVKTELGKELRRFFVPNKPDGVLIDADYSQIELRLFAHISGDEKMCEAFRRGADIHAATASEVFSVPIEQVTPLQRKNAKAVNFGIVYGVGAYTLSQELGITKREADEYIKSYFERYPKIREYIDKTVKQAHENGYVSTIFGRKRYIPELTSSRAMLRSFGERVAMNSPIQGTSADIIKLAMVEISEKLKQEKLDAEIILQVHDELIICSSKEDAPKAEILLKQGMENVAKLSVPLIVDVSTADNWYDCK